MVAAAHTIADMELIRRREPTGAYCGGNHPELVEHRYVIFDGEEFQSGQSDPRCFRDGCPDNVAALAREQRRARRTL